MTYPHRLNQPASRHPAAWQRAALLAAFTCVAGLALPAPSRAAPPAPKASQVTASDAWVRWLPGGLPEAGYLTLTNGSATQIDLVEVETDDFKSAMLHQSTHDGSTDRMIMIDRLPIPPHGQVKLSPGGYHLMLEHATHTIAVGNTVHLQLQFSDGSALEVAAPVSGSTRTQ